MAASGCWPRYSVNLRFLQTVCRWRLRRIKVLPNLKTELSPSLKIRKYKKLRARAGFLADAH
jgi:hypothetical protein